MTEPARSSGVPEAAPHVPELHALGLAQVDQLAGMVLELAAQLHVERVRLRALEYHLCERGVLSTEELVVVPLELGGQLAGELDHALAGLLGPATERDDARMPQRAASTASTPGTRTESEN